jgi:hypothetical protein
MSRKSTQSSNKRGRIDNMLQNMSDSGWRGSYCRGSEGVEHAEASPSPRTARATKTAFVSSKDCEAISEASQAEIQRGSDASSMRELALDVAGVAYFSQVLECLTSPKNYCRAILRVHVMLENADHGSRGTPACNQHPTALPHQSHETPLDLQVAQSCALAEASPFEEPLYYCRQATAGALCSSHRNKTRVAWALARSYCWVAVLVVAML